MYRTIYKTLEKDQDPVLLGWWACKEEYVDNISLII